MTFSANEVYVIAVNARGQVYEDDLFESDNSEELNNQNNECSDNIQINAEDDSWLRDGWLLVENRQSASE